MTDLATRLRDWRRHNKISQRQAAEVMVQRGVPIKTIVISWCEQGRPIGKWAPVLQAFIRRYPTLDDAPPRYPGHRVRSTDDKASMRAMRDHGMELAKIGKHFGISESAVSHSLTRESKKIRKKIQP